MDVDIEKELQRQLIVPREQRLLSLLFKEHVSKEDVEHQLQGLHIDTENHYYLLMLARLGFERNWVGFPEHVIPQLKGIYRYYQAQNALLLQMLMKTIKQLNEEQITPLLIKGVAMRLHYAPGVARIMDDADIVIEGKQYDKAMSIVQGMGAAYVGYAKHSSTYKLGHAEFDLHHVIYKNHNEKGSDIWRQVERIEVNGCHFNLLSPIDMFIHVLDTQSRDIFLNEHMNRRMKWLFDAKMVLNRMPDKDWAAIAKRAHELHCNYRVCLMMKLFAACFPEDISLADVEALFTVDQGYARWLQDAVNYRETIVQYVKERNVYVYKFITPRVFKLRVKYNPLWKEYNYQAHELKRLSPGMSYIRYVVEHYQLHQPRQFFKRIVLRLRFR